MHDGYSDVRFECPASIHLLRGVRVGEPGGAFDPLDGVLEPDAREDRDAVPLGLAVAGDGIAARGERLAQEHVEGGVGELGLLQADDVRAALVEPGKQARQPSPWRIIHWPFCA